MAQITVTPYAFGHPEPNEPVTITTAGIIAMYQTVRDDDIFDDEYRGKLLTRILRSGLEIVTDEPVADVIGRWAADDSLKLAWLSRAPTDKPGDDPVVAVNASRVTDVRAVPADRYAAAYRTLVFFGGVRVAVVEEPDEVRRRLDEATA